MNNEYDRFFIALWLGYGAVGLMPFYFWRNARFKRRYFPWYLASGGVLLLAVWRSWGMPLPMLALAAPLVGVTLYLNLRTTQFCDGCSRTVLPTFLFSRPSFCPSCGRSLGEATGGDDAK